MEQNHLRLVRQMAQEPTGMVECHVGSLPRCYLQPYFIESLSRCGNCQHLAVGRELGIADERIFQKEFRIQCLQIHPIEQSSRKRTFRQLPFATSEEQIAAVVGNIVDGSRSVPVGKTLEHSGC